MENDNSKDDSKVAHAFLEEIISVAKVEAETEMRLLRQKDIESGKDNIELLHLDKKEEENNRDKEGNNNKQEEGENISHHSERIEHDEIEHDLNLNINQNEEREKEEEERKKREEEEEINRIITTNEILNTNVIQTNNNDIITSPNRKINKPSDFLNNLSSQSNNNANVVNDSFDRKLEELRNKIQNSKSPKKQQNWPAFSPTSCLSQLTSPNKKLGELFNMMGISQTFKSVNEKVPNIQPINVAQYKPILSKRYNQSANETTLNQFKKGIGYKLKPVIIADVGSSTTTNKPKNENNFNLTSYIEKRKKRGALFSKDYFNDELTKFNEKLFGKGFKNSNKMSLSQSRKFNRLNLVI